MSLPAVPSPTSAPPPDPRPAWFRVGIVLASAIGYFAAARLGYAFTIRPASVALWPAAGLLLGALLVVPSRWWPEMLFGALLGNVTADLLQSSPPGVALVGGVVNGLESLLAATVVRLLVGERIVLKEMWEYVALTFGAVVLSNSLTALLGSLVLSHGTGGHFWANWFKWWAGDGLGMLLVTPVVLTWASHRAQRALNWRKVFWFGALCSAIAFLSWHALGEVSGFADSFGTARYLVFPLLFLAALGYGPWGASTAALLVGCVVAWKGAHADPAFLQPGMTALDQVREIGAYLVVASCSAMVPAVEWNARREAEAQLRISEARFRQMAEHIEDAFFVVDLPSMQAVYISPNWVQLWGRPLAEGYDSNIWFEAIHPEDRSIVAQSLENVQAGLPESIRVRVVRPDESVIWIRSRSYPVRDRHGQVYRFVGVATDITAFRNAEERLVLSQKMEALGRLAGGVAHDFNNMLTVILADTDLLGQALAGTEYAEQIAEIRAAAARSASLTKQLLAFSRRQVVPSTVFDVNTVLEELGLMLQRAIGERIQFSQRPAKVPCLVRADRAQLEQVITNLALNARDAMPEGGRLAMETSVVKLDEAFVEARHDVHPGQYVLLSVTDTGIGMSESVRARVFEPFFTTKPHGQGTGLGLATSYGFVQKCGGYLTVYSEVGVGSTFRVYLPLVDPVERETSEAPQPAIPTGTETILLVEDEAGVRRVTSRFLASFGYQVLEAELGKVALAILSDSETPISLLLTDVMLPEMGGRELAERVRAQVPSIKVLFMSGYTEDAILNLRLIDEGSQLLGKPFTRDELAQAVRAAIDHAPEVDDQPPSNQSHS